MTSAGPGQHVTNQLTTAARASVFDPDSRHRLRFLGFSEILKFPHFIKSLKDDFILTNSAL